MTVWRALFRNVQRAGQWRPLSCRIPDPLYADAQASYQRAKILRLGSKREHFPFGVKRFGNIQNIRRRLLMMGARIWIDDA